MTPSAVNEARREIAQLRSAIDDARRELGIDTKPAQIAAQRSGRRRLGLRKTARAARKSSAA
jgi:hypothetical protein